MNEDMTKKKRKYSLRFMVFMLTVASLLLSFSFWFVKGSPVRLDLSGESSQVLEEIDLQGDFEIIECVTYKLPRRKGRWFLFALKTEEFSSFDKSLQEDADLIFRRFSTTSDKIDCEQFDTYLRKNLGEFLFEPNGATLSVSLLR